MHAALARTTRFVLAAIALGSCAAAFAGPEMLDVESRFRAKIIKEKVRTAAQQRQIEEQERDQERSFEKPVDESHCGSQSIGNVDTGGRPGTAPREEFVFAPNAINIVGRGGCR
jgi:hypothetical protein